MRISAVGLVIVLGLLSACTSGGGENDLDDVASPDAYTAKITTCLSEGDEQQAPGEALEGPAPEAVTTDTVAGVTYRAYAAPWDPFDLTWTTPELGLTFTVGQKQRVETGTDGTPNWAAIGSTRMPNVVGDAVVTDLDCMGAFAVADVIAMTGYESGAASTEVLEQGPREVDGRRAWLNVSRYQVIDERFDSKSELQGTLLVETDRGVCVMFVTIPDVRTDLDQVIAQVFASVHVL